MALSRTLSLVNPEPAVWPAVDELAGCVTIQSVLDMLVALKIDLALSPGSSATAVRNATATIDAAIRELRTGCGVASAPSAGAAGAAHYFSVIKARA